MRVFLVKIKRVYFAPNKTRRRAPPRVNLRLIDRSLEQSHEILEIHMKKSILSTLIIASVAAPVVAKQEGADYKIHQDANGVVHVYDTETNLVVASSSTNDGIFTIRGSEDQIAIGDGVYNPATGERYKNIHVDSQGNIVVGDQTHDNTLPPIDNEVSGVPDNGVTPPVDNELPPIDAEAAIEYIGEQGAAAYASLDERVGSLENEMFLFKEEVNQRFDATNASLHAVTNARPMVADGQTAIGVGTGFAGSAQAIAIGAAHSFEGTGWSASATINQTTGDYTEFNGGAGVQYAF